MKATTAPTIRPARRMSLRRWVALTAQVAARHDARQAAWQARQDAAEQAAHPTQEFAPAPRLTMLPGGLHWSAQGQVPAVGATVQVQENGQARPAQVTAYCHAAGFLGLVVEPQQPARPTKRKASPRAQCVFGHQLQVA